MDFLVKTRAHPVDMVFSRFCGLVPDSLVGQLAYPLGTISEETAQPEAAERTTLGRPGDRRPNHVCAR
jgi:hypothetical protein